MLYLLHIPYNSEEGFKTAEKVMKCIQDAAFEMSCELAEEKGSFPYIDKSIYKQHAIKIRNAARTTIAPTGTISMIFDVSSGVEPYFALAYHYEGILGGNTQLFYINKHLKHELEQYNLYNDHIMKRIFEEGTLQNIEEIPQELKSVFITAMDITPEDHTRMQAAFQKYCDNAISKTINFPESATREDVLQGYILAWELGCKGCTVYRNNSRRIQVLNLNKKKEEEGLPEETEKPKATVVVTSHEKQMTVCPDCDTMLEQKEGCIECPNCGWGLCSG
jgi:ribonucleoside-diphosphate reductase alpha chain